MKIFTYGTLMSGCGNHHVLTDSLDGFGELIRIEEASYKGGKMFDTGFGYPLVAKTKTGIIKGELIEFKDPFGLVINNLDHLESGYIREEVKLKNGEKAWIYFATRRLFSLSENIEIKSNDWKEYKLKKSKGECK